MMKDFDAFMLQLAETNATLDYYSDFNKIRQNVDDISISLNMLNFLLGKENIAEAVHALWERDPRVFDVLDILIATRKRDKKKFMDDDGQVRLVSSLFESEEGVVRFLKETGLAEMFRNGGVNDLVDYVLGVETGLDSNARKNRSGDITALLLSRIFQTNGIIYRKEVPSKEFPAIQAALGKDEKRFDFVVETTKRTFLLEVNFYNVGGSKPNEVARAYRELAPIINGVDGFEFVWITDGRGWEQAKGKLSEAYAAIPRVYNFKTLPDFIKEVKTKL